MLSMSSEKHFTFNVFIETVEGGAFVAHCLETGLVATSKDCEELPHKMAKMLVRQIQFALKNNNPGDIFHPAPRDIWEKFMRTKGQMESTRKPIKIDDVGGLVLTQNAYAAAC
jgi:hypothetical protein